MPETYGYVRTSRPRVSELAGSDPETQRQQLLAAGVALSHIYQDVGVSGTSGTNSRRGWHSLDSRLAQGDTLVVVSIDRIGRRWLDTMGNIHDLQRRGVRIRSLADNEQSWAQYLDADPESPESFLGYTLAGFAAWVSDQELVSIRRRTKAGLAKAKADGKKLGAPRRLSGGAGGRGHRDGGQRRQPAATPSQRSASASGASPGPSAYRLRQSGAP